MRLRLESRKPVVEPERLLRNEAARSRMISSPPTLLIGNGQIRSDGGGQFLRRRLAPASRLGSEPEVSVRMVSSAARAPSPPHDAQAPGGRTRAAEVRAECPKLRVRGCRAVSVRIRISLCIFCRALKSFLSRKAGTWKQLLGMPRDCEASARGAPLAGPSGLGGSAFVRV